MFFIKAGDGKKRKRGGGLKKQAGTRKVFPTHCASRGVLSDLCRYNADYSAPRGS